MNYHINLIRCHSIDYEKSMLKHSNMTTTEHPNDDVDIHSLKTYFDTDQVW